MDFVRALSGAIAEKRTPQQLSVMMDQLGFDPTLPNPEVVIAGEAYYNPDTVKEISHNPDIITRAYELLPAQVIPLSFMIASSDPAQKRLDAQAELLDSLTERTLREDISSRNPRESPLQYWKSVPLFQPLTHRQLALLLARLRLGLIIADRLEEDALEELLEETFDTDELEYTAWELHEDGIISDISPPARQIVKAINLHHNRLLAYPELLEVYQEVTYSRPGSELARAQRILNQLPSTLLDYYAHVMGVNGPTVRGIIRKLALLGADRARSLPLPLHQAYQALTGESVPLSKLSYSELIQLYRSVGGIGYPSKRELLDSIDKMTGIPILDQWRQLLTIYPAERVAAMLEMSVPSWKSAYKYIDKNLVHYLPVIQDRVSRAIPFDQLADERQASELLSHYTDQDLFFYSGAFLIHRSRRDLVKKISRAIFTPTFFIPSSGRCNNGMPNSGTYVAYGTLLDFSCYTPEQLLSMIGMKEGALILFLPIGQVPYLTPLKELVNHIPELASLRNVFER